MNEDMVYCNSSDCPYFRDCYKSLWRIKDCDTIVNCADMAGVCSRYIEFLIATLQK